jgi:DNA-binding response OmpR family regulator
MADIVLIHWPDEREEARHLADAGTAVLYLVSGDDDPPKPTGCLEDWARVPGDERDLLARVAALERRAAAHAGPPWVADNGLLHHRGKSVHLSPVEARLAEALTAQFCEVVPDEVLIERATAGTDTVDSLRAEIARLRSRVRLVDLLVPRVTKRGYRMKTR